MRHHHHSTINDLILEHTHDPRLHNYDGAHHHDDAASELYVNFGAAHYDGSAVHDDDYPTDHLNDR